MTLSSAFDLPIPRNNTALMLHLQRLVGYGNHRFHCGGQCPLPKLPSLIEKMEDRYALTRNARQRSYDRQQGRAAIHMIVYPLLRLPHNSSRTSGVFSLGDGRAFNAKIVEAMHRDPSANKVAWWLVSGPGTGGLTDPGMPDAHVARDAESANGHIVHGDYVLLYGNKKIPSTITNSRIGRTTSFLKNTSTWTWKMRGEIVKEVQAAIDDCCAQLAFGSEPTGHKTGHGLQGLLHSQRSRPLFSGVRTQVLALEKYARDEWRARIGLWRATHPDIVARRGEAAGELRSISELVTGYLPKMTQMTIYDDPPLRVRDLTRPLG